VLLRVFFGTGATSSFPYLTALGLMALCVVVAVAAAIVTAWGAASEKPLHVLRYE
jgi:ABC-type antimicrobial peptide transport system permease subunit